MAGFAEDIVAAAGREREVTLTTRGRKTGKPQRVTIWIGTDGKRIFIRSGGGLGRHWPRNLLAAREGSVRLGGRAVKVAPRHVTDPEEARAVSELYRKKYGSYVKPSTPDQPLTEGEKATFELTPIA